MSGKLQVNLNTKDGLIELRFGQPLEIAQISIPAFKRLAAALLTAEAAAAEAAPNPNGGSRIIRLG